MLVSEISFHVNYMPLLVFKATGWKTENKAKMDNKMGTVINRKKAALFLFKTTRNIQKIDPQFALSFASYSSETSQRAVKEQHDCSTIAAELQLICPNLRRRSFLIQILRLRAQDTAFQLPRVAHQRRGIVTHTAGRRRPGVPAHSPQPWSRAAIAPNLPQIWDKMIISKSVSHQTAATVFKKQAAFHNCFNSISVPFHCYSSAIPPLSISSNNGCYWYVLFACLADSSAAVIVAAEIFFFLCLFY